MKLFKKIISFIFIICLSFLFIGCDNSNNDNNNNNNNNQQPTSDVINIYAVSDFHGAIESTNGRYGIARMASYLKAKEKVDKEDAIILSAGDMFQGTAISNYNRGLDVIRMMNMMNFDAMSIGNHEFDWYLDTILKYRDGLSANGEANFPLLGCNIYQKSTGGIPQYVEPYTIIDTGELLVGVVGYLGYGQESDIQAGQVADYQFLHPVEVVKEYVKEMRTMHDVDIVIANGHDASDNVNQALANLTGDYQVDAIINGHSHVYKSGALTSSDNRKVPVVQAGANGEFVANISLTVDLISGKITETSQSTTRMDDKISEDPAVLSYVEDLKSITDPLFNEVLGRAGVNIDRAKGALWAANSLRDYSDADFAAINLGGIRSTAFPISVGEGITISRIFKMMPFENCLKTVTLTGAEVKRLLAYDLVYSNNVNKTEKKINGEVIEDNKTYRVATIDYVYDNPSYPFLKFNGTDVDSTKILFRDILIDSLREQCKDGSLWMGE